jgi:hypothetical protein
MLKKIILLFSVFFVIAFILQENLQSSTSGGPSGYAGAPAEGGRTCGSGGGCHTGTSVTTQTGLIASDIPSTGYIPGTTYNITASITGTSSKFGFEVSPQNTSGTKMGTLIITNSTQTQLVGSGKYITHKSGGTAGTNSKIWTFQWKAPSPGTGDFKFYGTFNITNSNGSDSGDKIVKSITAVIHDTTTIASIDENKISDFEYQIYPNPTQDLLNINTHAEKFSYKIFNLSGELVLSEEKISERKINIRTLPNGQYILFIESGDFSAVRKFIKIQNE